MTIITDPVTGFDRINRVAKLKSEIARVSEMIDATHPCAEDRISLRAIREALVRELEGYPYA